MAHPSSNSSGTNRSVSKSLPLVKIKRVRGGLYRVYKLVGGNYKIKRMFFTMHQANRYVKGMK